ncbi:MAG: hypothetical protein ACI9ZT_000323 [Gammaproteobacteria bacterium]|jgi:hypothetical protein
MYLFQRIAVLGLVAVIASCANTPVDEGVVDNSKQRLTTAQFNDAFIDQEMNWTHKTGAGGKMILNADGTMIYDVNGKTRKAKWILKNDEFCVNVGEKDETCLVLISMDSGFASEDGSFTYQMIN